MMRPLAPLVIGQHGTVKTRTPPEDASRGVSLFSMAQATSLNRAWAALIG